MKRFKTLFITLILCIAISTPALALDTYYDTVNVPVQALLTGVVIEPLAINQFSEYSDHYYKSDYSSKSGFGLDWGGLSIDVLAVQAGIQMQSMGLETGCCDRNYSYYNGGSNVIDQSIKLKSDGLTIKMTQYARQGGEISASANSYRWVD